MSLEAKKPVIIWRVDIVFLTKEDWKYEASTAGSGGGGRTHTFWNKKILPRDLGAKQSINEVM
jgi:hypothetical protein